MYGSTYFARPVKREIVTSSSFPELFCWLSVYVACPPALTNPEKNLMNIRFGSVGSTTISARVEL